MGEQKQKERNKKMSHNKCKCCGNSYHWREAFAKFGHKDGDGQIQTFRVGHTLQKAGYHVSYLWWRPHNIIIFSIRRNGIEFMPSKYSGYCIGYSDPVEYLPVDILKILEEEFPTPILFR